MDDRFDRRELPLHLGDMLKALSCLAKTGRAPVTCVSSQVARDLKKIGGDGPRRAQVTHHECVVVATLSVHAQSANVDDCMAKPTARFENGFVIHIVSRASPERRAAFPA